MLLAGWSSRNELTLRCLIVTPLVRKRRKKELLAVTSLREASRPRVSPQQSAQRAVQPAAEAPYSEPASDDDTRCRPSAGLEATP